MAVYGKSMLALVGLTVALTVSAASAQAHSLAGGSVKASYALGAYVTVSDQGHKYLFQIDTGAASSAVTGKAAKELGLTSTVPSRPVATIGCRSTEQPAQISGWRLGHIALPPTQVGIINNSLSHQKFNGRHLSGLLGSDVLSQFGVVTFDLAQNRLILGQRSTYASSSIPMTVRRDHGQVAELIRATIDHRASTFILDTGSPLTVVQSSLASRIGLKSLVHLKTHGAAGCAQKAGVSQIVQWNADGQPLPSTPALIVNSPELKLSSTGPPVGLIGAATLFSFGRLTLDFTHHRLILGSPAPRSMTASDALSGSLWDPQRCAIAYARWESQSLARAQSACRQSSPTRPIRQSPTILGTSVASWQLAERTAVLCVLCRRVSPRRAVRSAACGLGLQPCGVANGDLNLVPTSVEVDPFGVAGG